MSDDVTVELKLLDARYESEWGLPAYASAGAAAIDIRAAITELTYVNPGQALLIPSGLALHPQQSHVAMLLLPRSGKGHREGLVLGNGIGLIDADYQGEIKISACNRNATALVAIEPGERIAQLMFIPFVRAVFNCVTAFSTETARGAGGFGHSGRS